MTKRALDAITSWPYLLCLLLLILNDLLLKMVYPGFVTGKLSDFAGIVVVALPLFAIFPNRALLIYCGIAGIFAWWKSPASTNAIEFLHAYGIAHLGRTVDYGDLVALAVLPICHAVANAPAKLYMPWKRFRTMLAIPVGVVSILAILGTSYVPLRQNYTIRGNSPSVAISRDEVAESIRSIALTHGLTCRDCSNPNEKASYTSDSLDMEYSFSGVNAVSFEISAIPSGRSFGLFGSSGEEKIDSLSRSLKKEFSMRFQGMEYIEHLQFR